jgi:hypothetical protein
MKTIALAFSLFAATAGCSTLPHATSATVARNRAERHGATPVYVGVAKTLVRGPALIRHLEIEGDGPLALYLADDPGVADRVCSSASAEGAAAIAVLAANSRLTNLTVPDGKRICATTEGAPTRVAWHARTGDAPVRSIDVALLSR